MKGSEERGWEAYDSEFRVSGFGGLRFRVEGFRFRGPKVRSFGVCLVGPLVEKRRD